MPGARGVGIRSSSRRGMAGGVIPMQVKVTHDEDHTVSTDGVVESGFSADLPYKSGSDHAPEWAWAR
jgi:hypothetical protein